MLVYYSYESTDRLAGLLCETRDVLEGVLLPFLASGGEASVRVWNKTLPCLDSLETKARLSFGKSLGKLQSADGMAKMTNGSFGHRWRQIGPPIVMRRQR